MNEHNAVKNYKKYIGDSVYAYFDGNQIVLTTENGEENDPSNVIFLEPIVVLALTKYIEERKEELYGT